MDFCRNASVSGGVPPEYEPEQLFSPPGNLDDLFSSNCPEGDMNMEWLSIYVEDCLSSSGNCLPPPAASGVLPPRIVEKRTSSPRAPAAGNSKPLQLMKSQRNTLQKFVIPGKARSKRNRGDPIGSKSRRSPNQFTSWTHHFQLTSSDPPLLQQAYWLADSELILPKNEEKINSSSSREIIRMKYEKNEEEDEEGNNVNVEEEDERLGSLEGSNRQPRRCTHCLSQRTPQWRGGPLGPKTLCNACGVRYKSGRLLPEYRPAKSPTFVSYKHSNSHKKVLEMRNMSLLSPPVLGVLKIGRFKNR